MSLGTDIIVVGLRCSGDTSSIRSITSSASMCSTTCCSDARRTAALHATRRAHRHWSERARLLRPSSLPASGGRDGAVDAADRSLSPTLTFASHGRRPGGVDRSSASAPRRLPGRARNVKCRPVVTDAPRDRHQCSRFERAETSRGVRAGMYPIALRSRLPHYGVRARPGCDRLIVLGCEHRPSRCGQQVQGLIAACRAPEGVRPGCRRRRARTCR